jgi:molybdate transport system substrate-binding protein
VICSILIFLNGLPLYAGEMPDITVAAASNFIRPMDKIVEYFEAEQDITVDTVYSSTGKLYAQIKNGAPYDIFFAADSKRPELLYKEGFCKEPFIYAKGEVVLWAKQSKFTKEAGWQEVVTEANNGKIAISSPLVAPYGEVAAKALKQAGLWQNMESRLVYAQNVAQAFQYGHQGATDLTFTALSYALSEHGRQGLFWRVPEAPEVIQKGCVLNKTGKRTMVESFLAFLNSGEAQEIMTTYGYH